MLRSIQRAGDAISLSEQEIDRVLAFARTHLGMDVAWISRTESESQVIEALDGASDDFGLTLGADLWQRGWAMVGARALAPLRLSNGRIYGYLGCFNRAARAGLQARDDEFLQLAAALLAPSLDAHELHRDRQAEVGSRIQAVLDGGGPDMVYQPIVSLPEGRTVAFEAFSRFPGRRAPGTPDRWFADAHELGVGPELEIAAIRCALNALDWLDSAQRVAVNASAVGLLQEALLDELDRHDPTRIIVEITEHERVLDYEQLRGICRELRDRGITIAVDDAGAGYAGFAHLVEIRPDIIKLDHQITQGLDVDAARSAMGQALVGFAGAIGATVLAEGVETPGELAAATRLGIGQAQGYHVGRPHPLPLSASARVLDLRDPALATAGR